MPRLLAWMALACIGYVLAPIAFGEVGRYDEKFLKGDWGNPAVRGNGHANPPRVLQCTMPPAKSSFIPGEPVVMLIEARNISPKPVECIYTEECDVSFGLCKKDASPDEIKRSWRSIRQGGLYQGLKGTVNPGKSVTIPVVLNRWHSTRQLKSGSYLVVCHLDLFVPEVLDDLKAEIVIGKPDETKLNGIADELSRKDLSRDRDSKLKPAGMPTSLVSDRALNRKMLMFADSPRADMDRLRLLQDRDKLFLSVEDKIGILEKLDDSKDPAVAQKLIEAIGNSKMATFPKPEPPFYSGPLNLVENLAIETIYNMREHKDAKELIKATDAFVKTHPKPIHQDVVIVD
jgi:hypothetical protein